ncbi:glycosyltransferase family 39 protein [Ktedonosporobacter rubrisoli]|uniref:glycosyltransferase family 39 protein n=1 Tax=Ktedonosporobacter rubrisoli TaxID=2509675 RepID=UPI001A910257|nr:glycosyltransferase family 39 protein [Ktedonosporobacter rubrisoli]
MLAICFNFLYLGQQGYGNLYYATTVKSMLMNWHNFFFVSFDPGGFVSVDKPPLGFWLQAASARLFGLSGWSLAFPQASAGSLSVIILAQLVRHYFGSVAGLLAGLTLALTPISVVTSRNNTIDSMLVLILLLTAWAVWHACETGHLRWLLLGAFLLGLGFNIKMLQAYLVIPALTILYLLGSSLSMRRRLGQLALAAVVLLVISLSWSLAVDMTPAAQRPYVGSSTDNSEVSLALGYNGIFRLLGITGMTQEQPAASRQQQQMSMLSGSAAAGVGEPGPFRLLQEPPGGQISWLLPLAIFGLFAEACRHRLWRFPLQPRQQGLVLWSVWLLTMLIFFSLAGYFYAYYLVMLAPALSALVGIGIVALWRQFRRPGWLGWGLLLAILVTTVEQCALLAHFPAWSQVLVPVILCFELLVAIILAVTRLSTLSILPQIPGFVVSVGLLLLLLTPALWSAISVWLGADPEFPVAGPAWNSTPTQVKSVISSQGMFPDTNPKLLQYVQHARGKTRVLLVTLNALSASPIILATSQPVLALGGFTGRDPVFSVAQISDLLHKGTVRFFLLPTSTLVASMMGGSVGNNDELMQWVRRQCALVSPQLWQAEASESTFEQLFDCAQMPAGRVHFMEGGNSSNVSWKRWTV